MCAMHARMTAAQYLRLERAAPYKSEFYNGQMIARAGASEEHNVCGHPQFEDAEADTLLNPILLIEIVSPATEFTDRSSKFHDYRRIESLREYILIQQNRPHIERYRRGDGGEWILNEAHGLDASIELTAIGCTLALADVYERVEFPSMHVGEAPEGDGGREDVPTG